MAASSNELPPGGFGLGLALLRGNSLLSNERQDDPVIFDDEEWQLSTVLGTGTSSTVFAAHKTAAQSEPTRAVKVIMVELMGTSERTELRLEYELWSQLRHPHVIQMFGSVLSDARYRPRPRRHCPRPRRHCRRPRRHCRRPRRHCPRPRRHCRRPRRRPRPSLRRPRRH